MLQTIFFLCAAFILASCSDSTDLPQEQYDKVDIGVYFYYPKDNIGNSRSDYLGKTHGVSSCGKIATNWAYIHHMIDPDWGCVCYTYERRNPARAVITDGFIIKQTGPMRPEQMHSYILAAGLFIENAATAV